MILLIVDDVIVSKDYKNVEASHYEINEHNLEFRISSTEHHDNCETDCKASFHSRMKIKDEFIESHSPYRISDHDSKISALKKHPKWKLQEWKSDNLITEQEFRLSILC